MACDLSPKAVSSPITDICLRMVITSPFLELIRKALVDGLKKENWRVVRIRGQIPFVNDSKGLLTYCGRAWVLTTGGVR